MRIKPSERAIEMNGERRELQPRVMQVLVALAQARPHVVSRDRLMEQCWEGRIVGDDALNRCIFTLRHLADEFTPRAFAIDTVPRIGHRLLEGESASSGAIAEGRDPSRRRILILLALVTLMAAGLFAFFMLRNERAPDPVSIAVLPFRNISAGNNYFSEGVGDEIAAQLSREPAFRVAGRMSAAQFPEQAGPAEIGRTLGVDYLLEGSVRSANGRVRINASLVKTSDGMRVWSRSFESKLEDILQIQTAIGKSVAQGLSLRLVDRGRATDRPIDGRAYIFYLNARGLLRSNSPQVGKDAVDHLQQALRIDPNFAPAWGSMAEAILLQAKTLGADGTIDAIPRAEAAARRALQLNPMLAQPHALLGRITPKREAAVHFRRAAELDRDSGEGLLALAEAHYVSAQFPEWLSTMRRAQAADPLWPLPMRALMDVSSVMDSRPATEALVGRLFGPDQDLQNFALGRVAWTYGDYSEAARRWSIALANPESRWASPAQLSLDDLKLQLGLSAKPPSRPPLPAAGRFRWGPSVWMPAAPSPAEWRHRNRSQAAALVNLEEDIVAAKLMLNEGRIAELMATYDSPTGLLNVKRDQPFSVCMEEVAVVAMALRKAERHGEADALLGRAERTVRAAYARGRVPAWFHWEAASIWSVQGRHREALAALTRALQHRWGPKRRGSLGSIADEPALKPLHGQPAFANLVAGFDNHFRKEREETQRALASAT